ncbi:MAG: PIG-L family deacetylase, partial [Acidobacteriia bacterium]|nr:PIG-L family deacetylase [Terriglobia bacterium]
MPEILVVAAHPDDEVLGCGGTIARLVAAGESVHIAILGEGSTSRSPRREEADKRLVDALETHSRRAAKVLGVEDVYGFGLPDNRFDTVPLLEVVKLVEDLISRLRPVTVYTHHGGDLNADHGVVHRAVLTATRPMAGHPVRELFAFEVAS